MNLIGLSGYMGAGKDTVGQMIQYLTTYPNSLNKTDGKNRSFNSFVMDVGMGSEPEWEIKKFAAKLKKVASILTGIPVHKFEDQEFKKTKLGKEWGYKQKIPRVSLEQENIYYEDVEMTVRSFLQKLGVEAIRDGLHPNTWENALFADYLCTHDGDLTEDYYYPKWVITDCRFPNEAKAIKDRGGIVVRIERDYGSDVLTDTQLHPSETALDDWKFDYTIDNIDGINELIVETRKMLKHYEIIH